MKRKNLLLNKILFSNKIILGDTNMVTLNKENLYFLETELSGDDVAFDYQSLKSMKDSGLTLESTLKELIEVITIKGFNPILIEDINIDTNWTIEHMVKDVDGFEEWEIFENIVLYTGEDIEIRLENIGEDEE